MNKCSVFCACCAVLALLVCGATADAAQPSADKLSQMGLAGATVVSDGEAMAVRGFGWRGGRNHSGNRVNIYGDSKVEFEIEFQIGGADAKLELKSESGYDSKTKESASGKHLAFIGAKLDLGGNDNNYVPTQSVNTGGNHGGGGPKIVFFAGGHSSVKVGGHSGHRGGGRR